VYDRPANIEDTFTNEDDEAAHAMTHEARPFTPKQGQYLRHLDRAMRRRARHS
jgi:hypothetical protein